MEKRLKAEFLIFLRSDTLEKTDFWEREAKRTSVNHKCRKNTRKYRNKIELINLFFEYIRARTSTFEEKKYLRKKFFANSK